MGRGTYIISVLNKLHANRNLEKCLSSPVNNSKFVVFEDSEDISSIKLIDKNDDGVGFLVLNPHRRYINLLATDHCFFTDKDNTQKCDFILFDDAYFCFVELKWNVSKRKQVRAEKIKAGGQLETTIMFFTDSFSQETRRFFGYKLEAYIVMRDKFIRNIDIQSYPRQPAQKSSLIGKFKKKYNVELIMENRKTFD